MPQNAFPSSDLPILTTLKEIEALFDRAASFVETAPDRVHLLAIDMPHEMGSFSELVRYAGAEGAIRELVAKLWSLLSGSVPVHALVLPDGRVVLTAHPDKRSDELFRLALVSSEAEASETELDAVVQILIGINALHGTVRTAPPLASSEDWDTTVRKMLTRKRIEAKFAKVLAQSRNQPPAPRRTSVVDDHLRWLAREMLRTPSAARNIPQAAAPDFRPVDPRNHIVNMRFGKLSPRGLVSTTQADLREICRSAASFVAETGGDIMVYAHGGLTSEAHALAYVEDTVDWWMKNKVFPIFCVWETDALSSIFFALRGTLGSPSRGFASDLRDGATEALVRTGGQPVWQAMKTSALLASQPDGGLALLAQELNKAFGSEDLPLHLVGHSAGAVLHLHWLPVLHRAKRPPLTFQTLAPAATTELARQALDTGPDVATIRCRVYNLTDTAERDDTVGAFYGKSLLYLVSRAFEPDGPIPLLGMQRHLMADTALLTRLAAGNGGNLRETIVHASARVFPGTDRLASTAKTHGDFDNDATTMQSALLFIRPGLDPAIVPPFPATPRARGADVLFPSLPQEAQFYLSVAASAAPQTTPQTTPRPRPHPPAAPRGGAYRLLTIGIDAYPDQPLQGCVNDSNLWADWFRTRDFDCRQYTSPQDTTRDRIAEHLRDFVTSARPDDVLVWHFSGHGIDIADTDEDLGDETSNRDQAIVGYYATVPSSLIEHALIDDEIHNILQQLTPGAELLVFLDSCFSGSATRLAGGDRTRSLGRVVRPGHRARGHSLTGSGASRSGNPYTGTNHILFSAAGASQLAKELTVAGVSYGRFSHAVHQLLPGLAQGMTNSSAVRDFDTAVNLMTQNPQLFCDPSRAELPFALAGL